MNADTRSMMSGRTARATGTLAAVAALAALAAGGGAAEPAKNPCTAKASKGKPRASVIGAPVENGGKPVTVDMGKVPASKPSRPPRAKPHEMPQPSLRRAKKQKGPNPCVPHATPMAAAPAKP